MYNNTTTFVSKTPDFLFLFYQPWFQYLLNKCCQYLWQIKSNIETKTFY